MFYLYYFGERRIDLKDRLDSFRVYKAYYHLPITIVPLNNKLQATKQFAAAVWSTGRYSANNTTVACWFAR